MFLLQSLGLHFFLQYLQVIPRENYHDWRQENQHVLIGDTSTLVVSRLFFLVIHGCFFPWSC